MRKKGNKTPAMSWAEGCSRVFIRAIDKAQLIPLGVISFFLIMSYKLDSKDAASIITGTIEGLKDLSLIGYLLFIGTIVITVNINTRLRRKHDDECHRVGMEKTELQQKQLGNTTMNEKGK